MPSAGSPNLQALSYVSPEALQRRDPQEAHGPPRHSTTFQGQRLAQVTNFLRVSRALSRFSGRTRALCARVPRCWIDCRRSV
jgi:hypothetical protein